MLMVVVFVVVLVTGQGYVDSSCFHCRAGLCL